MTDITYIKTHEGWLYLAVVIDLFSRPSPWASDQWRLHSSWSAQTRMTTDLALQALLAAVWRRKPKTRVMIHSPSRGLKTNRCRAADQGSQFTSREGQLFLGQHNLDASMSRRGTCHDRAIESASGSRPRARAVAESFFQLLKRERIRRRTYLTRKAARQDVFALRRLKAIAYRPKDYIEMFYNPKR